MGEQTAPRKTGRSCWRLTPRKSLIFRRGAPRRWTRKSLRSGKRGAPHASKPCSFVAGHHVAGLGRAFVRVNVVLHTRQRLDPSSRDTTSLGPEGVFVRMDVVLHTRQRLDPSSRGTTSLGPEGSSSGWTWCFIRVKALILRRGAPRHWARRDLRPDGRGASHASKP